MLKSILNKEYIPQTRPYSKNELEHLRKNLYVYLKLSNLKVNHSCGHFYKIKENSRKEKELKENNNNLSNAGNCSCCWKLHKTPEELKNKAYSLVDEYRDKFYIEPENMTYDLFDLENTFYRWLYNDNYNDNYKSI